MAEQKATGKKKTTPPAGKRQVTFSQLWKDERTQPLVGLSMILLSLFLFVAFVSHLFNWQADQSIFTSFTRPWTKLFDNTIQTSNALGRLGAIVSHQFFYAWIGVTSFLVAGLVFAKGFNLFRGRAIFPFAALLRHAFFFLIWLPPTLHMVLGRFSFPFGGGYGKSLFSWLVGFMGLIGTALFLVFCLLGYLLVAYNIRFQSLFSLFTKDASSANTELKPTLSKDIQERENQEYRKEEALEIVRPDLDEEPEDFDTVDDEPEEDAPDVDLEVVTMKPAPADAPAEDLTLTVEKAPTEKMATGDKVSAVNYDPTLDLSSYKLPTIDLLEDYGDTQISIDKAELEKNKDQIISTLENYNISISKIKATVGPTVTLYEIVPAPGIRISKIKNLEDDIALSLSALGIRIIAPIPGKGTIGIEVPNRNKEVVSMRSLLASEKFIRTDMDLPIALGKNIAGENYIADLSKMPHLLVAGATGQGKSVGINAILMSLLYKKHPSQLKLVLIDPKKVELSLYKMIENHFLAKLPGDDEPIITDTKKVVYTLNALCQEMDTRYDLLKDGHVRNIKEYNEKFIQRRLNPNEGHHYLPYIVLVIDEFADLMMTAGKEIETPIARLAQLARAVGIHLIIATQRPSVNIITGIIKANFPARIAFKVTSKVDSRTILDQGGADQLIGRGDMLMSIGGHLVRLQCAFVDTHEVEQVVEFIHQQRGYPEPFLLPIVESEEDDMIGGLDPSERDEMFEEAARLIVRHQQGSTSMIQRRLKLGYNRAGRIMDQLERAGIVGPSEGSKPREVLYKTEYDLEQFLNQNL